MKKAFIFVLMCWFIGCSVNYKPTIQKNPVAEKINKITLSGYGETISPTGKIKITLIGSGEVEHIRSKTDIITITPRRFNPFNLDDIKEILFNLWHIFWAWSLSFILIPIFISAFTEITRRNIKGYIGTNPIYLMLKVIPARVWTVFYGGISYIIYTIFLQADWQLNLALHLTCILIANVGWELLVNWIGKSVITMIKNRDKKKI